MAYEFDHDARKEAGRYLVSADLTDQLRKQCEVKSAELGPMGIRGQAIRFSFDSWNQPPGLPESIPRTGPISRGQVLDIGQRVRETRSAATELLVASFVWGWGPKGYGPHRLGKIRAAAGERLESSLQCAIAAANPESGPPDPVSGYAQLYGGLDYLDRAAPGAEPWSRLLGFGPAFFTKFLYFSTPGALILDNRLANAVHDLSGGMPHLVTKDGRSEPWTPFRYAVYLHWMRQTAATVGVEPDLLELTLFEPPGDLEREAAAAD